MSYTLLCNLADLYTRRRLVTVEESRYENGPHAPAAGKEVLEQEASLSAGDVGSQRALQHQGGGDLEGVREEAWSVM